MSTRQEMRHNTAEQVVEYLQAARDIVDALEPTPADRQTLLAAAITLVSGKSITVTQPGPIDLAQLGRNNHDRRG